MSKIMRIIMRIMSMLMVCAIIIGGMSFINGDVSAASKKPVKPKITTTSVSNTTVKVTWGKAKNAKKYQVATQSDTKKWIKVKTVAKNAKNKKKFTKPNKYKVVPKGKKYVVYQYQYTYTNKKTIKARSYIFSGLKSNTKYTFMVRSVNGKKYSKWSTITRITKSNGIGDDFNNGYSSSNPITTPGTVVPITFGGITNTFTIGKDSIATFPTINGLPTEVKPITINPSRIDDASKQLYAPSIALEGTINGFSNGTWGYGGDHYRVACQYIYGVGYSQYANNYGVYIIRGMNEYYEISVSDPDTEVYWTIDGTEPNPNQTDLTIPGNEYPFGTLDREREYYPEPETIKMRGSVKNGEFGTIFDETQATDINRVIWIKIYHKGKVVGERYTMIIRENLQFHTFFM